MSINRYQIRFDQYGVGDSGSIEIPINMNYQLVDQDELVRTDFVALEVIKNTNPIIDYEKTRFKPAVINNTLISESNYVKYKLNFLNSSGQYNPNTYYSDLGFIDQDVRFRKKNFINSFLFLSFYDTDVPSTQRLISTITCYPKIDYSNYLITGQIVPVNTILSEFNLGNVMLNRNLNGQGFSIYHYKDEVILSLPKNLYMRASFNNAKDGKTTLFMSTNNTTITIDNLIRTTEGTTNTNNVFTKYILKKTSIGYYYEIDTTYSNNVQINGNDYVVDLYETTVV
jgi:hypothetical protein